MASTACSTLSKPWMLSIPEGRTFSRTPSIAATPDLLSLAPSVQSEKCSITPDAPRTMSGRAPRIPMTHMKRRNAEGRKPKTWNSAQAATPSTHHLLTFHMRGTNRETGVE